MLSKLSITIVTELIKKIDFFFFNMVVDLCSDQQLFLLLMVDCVILYH